MQNVIKSGAGKGGVIERSYKFCKEDIRCKCYGMSGGIQNLQKRSTVNPMEEQTLKGMDLES